MKECNVLPLHFVEGTFEELRCQNCELDSTGSDVNITHSPKTKTSQTSRKTNDRAIDAYRTKESPFCILLHFCFGSHFLENPPKIC